MRYFLDFGTHRFEGLEEFTGRLGIDTTWHVSCFEPNKVIFSESLGKYEELQKRYASLKFDNVAVMDYTGVVNFNRHDGAWKDQTKDTFIKGYTTGSNTLDINPLKDYGNGVVFNVEKDECPCVDVNEIVADIVAADVSAEIYIKCDIEGSEFKMLPRLLKSPFVRLVKGIWIEWHERFWQNLDPTNSEYYQKCTERRDLVTAFGYIGIPTYIHT